MAYRPPVTEQRFVLDTVARVQELSPDAPVDAILDALAAMTEGSLVPMGPVGDREKARWTPEGVRMPDGYHAAYKAIIEGGWTGLPIPEAYGGMGLSRVLSTVLLEDMASADMGFSLVVQLSLGAMDALLEHGSPEQRARWLPKLASGEWTGTMNLTEPQAGSDVGALRTSAVRQPDGTYRIKGQKIYITFGEHDLVDNIVHLVLARTPDAPPGSKGISLFIVPRFREDGTPNDVRAASIEHKMGIHSSPTCVMLYGENDDCVGDIIGGEGDGLRAMFTMMNAARLTVGLQGVAIAEAATQAVFAYAKERIQSPRQGSPSREPVAIIEHPDVRRMLLRCQALTMGARALVYAAVAAGEAGEQARMDLLTPLAKAWSTDIGSEVASLAIQVHGGMGFIEETGVARLYRDVRIAAIYEGTNGIQAADLVNRKLGLNGGAEIAALLGEVRADAAGHAGLLALVAEIEALIADYAALPVDDRLAGSVALLEMLAVAVAGGLMARQARAVANHPDQEFRAIKQAAARYFLDVLVAEARGLDAAARMGADMLYAGW